MKISEIITEKYKLRMPPTVYYELLADVREAEYEQKPKSEWEHDHEILKAYSDGANEVLDKIRAEIEQIAKDYDKFADYRRVRGLWIALKIIDKYKAESKSQESEDNE